MIRFLEVPDFHFSPANLEVCKSNGEAVRKAAIEQEVDFIALPGDLNDSAIYASHKGGYNELRAIIDSWAAVCPVVAIEGTPSHDAPGAYEGLSVTVLQPGKVYGYFIQNLNDTLIIGSDYSPSRGFFEIETSRSSKFGLRQPDAILFGIPEISKKTIQGRLNLPSEEANGEAELLLKKHIFNDIAPIRHKYENIPAIVLFHGNISDRDRSNETDEILKASDIIAREEWFSDINIDRVSCGHIHQPKEFNIAGYAGSWGASWNDVGFLPAFNQIELEPASDGFNLGIMRIPYGTPKRLKIRSADQAIEPGVAYWLESKDPAAALPDFVHPWSRITFDEPDRETRRVTSEEADKAQSLWDLAVLLDPKTPKKLKPLFDEISDEIPAPIPVPADVSLEELYIVGCTFFHGKDIKLRLSELSKGLTAISGGNGAGKSSLLAFCSPYPIIIGKDTESGRSSAIKEFFNKKDSNVYKKIRFNNQVHEHLITIKGAHTKTAKVECYLTIDNMPQLEKGTFDEFMIECERIYGAFEDYRITTFYEQPQQSQKTTSGLMSATKTTARDLVLGISGIDRDREKRYALDKKSELEKSLVNLRAKIEILKDKAPDLPALESEIETALSEIDRINKEIMIFDTQIGNFDGEIIKLDAQFKIEQDKVREIDQLDKDILSYDTKIRDSEKTIKERTDLLGSIDDFKKQLEADNINRNKAAENEKIFNQHQSNLNEVRSRNHQLQAKYDNDLLEERKVYEVKAVAYRQQENKRQADGRRISEIDNTIIQISDPCEACGHIKSTIAEAVKALEAERAELMSSNYTLTEPVYISAIQPPETEKEPLEPFIVAVSTLEPGLRSSLESRVNSAAGFQAAILAAEKLSKESRDLLKEACNKKAGIITDPNVETELRNKTSERDDLADERSQLQLRNAGLTETVRNLQINLDKAMAEILDLEDALSYLSDHESDLKNWDSVARMLNSDKIPALELEIILDNIDGEASRNIAPFRSSIYSFKTETQEMGKKSIVDRFDIKIHDATTGEYRSFFKHSPGEKAFFNDAYIKALLKLRNRKMLRNYSPIISDEADGPVEPGKVADYYEIQNSYFRDNKVLIVSHAPDAQNYIQNTINIEEIKR